MNLLLFILIYTALTISIIGYGFLFSIKFTKYNNITLNKISIGLIGLFGIFFSISLSYFTNLFFPHNNLHNLIFIFFGILFFIIFFKKYKKNINFKYFIFSFIIFFFAILYFKSHDDFSYYHLSLITNLTFNKVEFGLAHFDVAFNHNSSLFYFHSLFRTSLTNDYFYQIGQASIVIFVNTFLLQNILSSNPKKKLTISFFLSLLLLIFINIFFYRLAEHGTDRSAQILFFLTFILTLKIFENKKNINEIFELMLVIFTLIVTIKSFYLLYSILLIYIYLKFFYKKNFINLFRKFHITFFCIATFMMMIFSNISHSGCFIYPIASTCPNIFFWTYGYEKVSGYMNWYELWSKAGATPNYIVENIDYYLTGLNWVPNWIDNYFFNKFSDYLFGVLLTTVIFLVLFKFKIKKFNLHYFKKYTFLYLLLILLFFEWFFQHPALRYGGYVLVFLIITFPLSLFLANQNFNLSEKNKPIKIILLITFVVFSYRNIDRLIKENEIYGYNVFKNPKYNIQKNFYYMDNIKQKVFKNPNICIESNSLEDIKCKKIASYNFYFVRK